MEISLPSKRKNASLLYEMICSLSSTLLRDEKYWLHILSVVDGFPARPYNGPDALYLVEREGHEKYEKHEKHEEHLSFYFINIPYCGGG